MRHRIRFLFLVLVPLIAVGGIALAWPEADEAEDNEVRVGFAQTPKAVQAAVRKLTTEESVTEIDKVDKMGITVYDVEYRKDGKTNSVTMSAAGIVIVSEDEIDVSSLPAAVRERIGSQFGGAELVKAESITLRYYKLHLAADGKKREVKAFASGHFDDDGEDEADDDDGDDDDDDDDEDEDEDDD